MLGTGNLAILIDLDPSGPEHDNQILLGYPFYIQKFGVRESGGRGLGLVPWGSELELEGWDQQLGVDGLGESEYEQIV